MKILFILIFQLFYFLAEAAPLKTNSLVVVHASRHYHTEASTIRATNELIRKARLQGQDVIALVQNDIHNDPDWYTFRSPPEITETFPSLTGQNELVPIPAEYFKVTLIGGYHSACLDWAMSDILSRALRQPQSHTIDIVLPMQAIFTGYRFIDGWRVPENPEMEAKADSSIDGLNLEEVTGKLSDHEFSEFILNTLTWSLYSTYPMDMDLSAVTFQLFRRGHFIKEFHHDSGSNKKLIQYAKTVRFNFD